MRIKGNYRLSFWMKLFWSILFVVMAVLFLFVREKINGMQTSQIASGLQDTISIYADSVDQSAESVEQYLYLSLDGSQDVTRIEHEEESLSYRVALQNVNDIINRIIGFNPNICDIVYSYQGEGKRVRMKAGTIGDYRCRMQLEEQIFAKLEDLGKHKEFLGELYECYQMDGIAYIVHYYKIQNSYLATCISTETIFSQLVQLDAEGVELFLTDREGNLLDCTSPLEQEAIPDSSGTFATLGGTRYLVTSANVLRGYFRIGTLTSQEVVHKEGRFVMEAIFFVFALVTGLGFPVVILFASRFILRPIHSMVHGMRQLATGNFEARIKVASPIQEYQVMGDTFNRMSQEIKHLKIENYESQIQVNKAQMQYLQLQISPHFYLNALNIIYSLGQIGDCAKIQQMAMHLVHYSRYMFHNVKELVTLAEELEHVREYLEIQKIRFGEFQVSLEGVDSTLEKLLIPPFVVQSFVENSVKYAVRRNRGCLWISAQKTPDGKTALLTVRDNGEGYSEQVLQAVQQGGQGEEGEKHVGIRNVQARLRIIYGEKASITLYNDQGAVTEVRLPLILQE